jgi:hypothetical protein
MDNTRFFTMDLLSEYIAGDTLKMEVIRDGQYPQLLVLSNFRIKENSYPISAVYGARLFE